MRTHIVVQQRGGVASSRAARSCCSAVQELELVAGQLQELVAGQLQELELVAGARACCSAVTDLVDVALADLLLRQHVPRNLLIQFLAYVRIREDT
jgi:hypothetical protein